MKDSGIEWIGEIPEEWETARIGSLYSLRNTKVSDLDYPPLSVTMKGIVPQLETAAKSNDHNNRKLVKKDDFVINSRSDRRGSCGISKLDGSVSLINIVLSPLDKMIPEYYNWLFTTPSFSDEFYKWGNGIVDDLWTTNWSKMKDINVPLPRIETQKKIADFLNMKVDHLNFLLKKINKEIDTLENYKKSVMTEAVTKGLDKNVEMKDSGIEWIGEIPRHWEVRQLKYVMNNLNYQRVPVDASKRNNTSGVLYDYYGATGVIDKIDGYTTVGRNILIGEDGANLVFRNLPLIYIAEGKYWVNNHAHILHPKNGNLDYYAYQMEIIDYKNYITGAAQPKLNLENLKKVKLVSPTPNDQEKIAEFLDKKTKLIDESITLKQKQLETLEEYKKSLIYEYVTGEKEVTDGERI